MAKSAAIEAPIVQRPKKLGRPSIFSQQLVDEVCKRVALGESLRSICRDDSMPNIDTIITWRNTIPSFSEQYARAKEDQAESFEDMMLEVARTEEDVQRAKLIIDTMKWTASKLKPKKYGDKLDLTSDGKALPQPLLGGVTIEAPKELPESN